MFEKKEAGAVSLHKLMGELSKHSESQIRKTCKKCHHGKRTGSVVIETKSSYPPSPAMPQSTGSEDLSVSKEPISSSIFNTLENSFGKKSSIPVYIYTTHAYILAGRFIKFHKSVNEG